MMLIGTVGQTIILEVAQDEDGQPTTAPTVSVVNAATGASLLASQAMTLEETVWKYAWDTTGLGTTYLQARALYDIDGWIVPESIQLNAVSGGGGSASILASAVARLARVGDVVRATFTLLGAAGAVDADSLPVCSVKKNGATVDTAAVGNESTGHYYAVFTVPGGYENGTVIELVAEAVIGGTTVKALVGAGFVISKMAFDEIVTLGDNTRVLELDGGQWFERRYAPGDTPGAPSVENAHVTDPYGNEIANISRGKLSARGVNQA